LLVYENFLPESYIADLSSAVIAPDFGWHYNKYTVSDSHVSSYKKNVDIRESILYTHGIFMNGIINSDYYPLFHPIKYFIEDRFGGKYEFQRIKMNMLPPNYNYKGKHNTPHSDCFFDDDTSKTKTVLVYLNDSDGDTYFFDQYSFANVVEPNLTIHKSVTPKRNCAVMFESNRLHASSPPSSSVRFTLNIVLKDIA